LALGTVVVIFVFTISTNMVLPVDNPTKSYWIEAAESTLRNFGSNEPLAEETDVAIVGSGYAGASTAYWIHKVCGHNS
jgi:hypothetical protein